MDAKQAGIGESVREKYGQAALRVNRGASSCCGNPTALAELRSGETVLDLGSGGFHRTDAMLSLAREKQRKAGAEDVEFLKGGIEQLSLPADSVDVIIGNCAIDLSADKDRVLREAFRVVKPGGRLAISDVVTRGAVPEEARRNMLLRAGCIADPLRDHEYAEKLAAAGFKNIIIEPTRIYSLEEARAFLSGQGIDVDAMAPRFEGEFAGAFIRAQKPASCRAPGFCA